MFVINSFFPTSITSWFHALKTNGDEHIHLPLACKKRISLFCLCLPSIHMYFPCTSEKHLEIKQLNGGGSWIFNPHAQMQERGMLWGLQDHLQLLLSCETLNLSAFHCFISPISKTQALISWAETLRWKGLGERKLFSVVWSPGLANVAANLIPHFDLFFFTP